MSAVARHRRMPGHSLAVGSAVVTPFRRLAETPGMRTLFRLLSRHDFASISAAGITPHAATQSAQVDCQPPGHLAGSGADDFATAAGSSRMGQAVSPAWMVNPVRDGRLMLHARVRKKPCSLHRRCALRARILTHCPRGAQVRAAEGDEFPPRDRALIIGRPGIQQTPGNANDRSLEHERDDLRIARQRFATARHISTIALFSWAPTSCTVLAPSTSELTSCRATAVSRSFNLASRNAVPPLPPFLAASCPPVLGRRVRLRP